MGETVVDVAAGARARALVVGGDSCLEVLVGEALASEPVVLATASSWDEALGALAADGGPCGVVVIESPGRGTEPPDAAARVTEVLRRAPGARVLVVAALCVAEEARACRAAGAFAYLVRGVHDLGTLRERVLTAARGAASPAP